MSSHLGVGGQLKGGVGVNRGVKVSQVRSSDQLLQEPYVIIQAFNFVESRA